MIVAYTLMNWYYVIQMYIIKQLYYTTSQTNSEEIIEINKTVPSLTINHYEI